MNIEYPGFGTIVVEGERFDHDVVIEKGVVRARDKGPSKAMKLDGHTPLSGSEDIPWSKARLVVGTGLSGRLPVTPSLLEEATLRGVRVDAMPTAEACALLRSLELDEVNAVLHVTC